MLLGLSKTLPSLIEAKFKAAKAGSSLLFSPTELAIIRTSKGIPFQLRYCPTLAKKPIPKHDTATPQEKVDPFEHPSSALHVIDIPTTSPSHLLVLNKFPIIAQHFIIATKPNKQQTHSLEQDDLEATYACLKAWQDDAGSKQDILFAFFNSGDHSGASQPHRHLQFLPAENMRDGEASRGWDLLIHLILSSKGTQVKGAADGLLQHQDLPFVHFAQPFSSEPLGDELLNVYRKLYNAAHDAVTRFITANPEQLILHTDREGALPISYNLAMTTSGMVILPRRAEGVMLRRDDGSDIGFVALNGTTLGGTMMVKHQEEWNVLRDQPEMLDTVLWAIGIPRESLSQKAHV
ncbi:Ap4A phosphorylase-like protein II [Phaeosphaeriaceae sp. PMI808]|nr:Ap4A phosphorylase-like protein II [Phaeosphaeriaceae sp. PMI808]